MQIPYTYDLPEAAIAQRPVRPYDHARLLSIDRKQQSLNDSVFYNLQDILKAGDLLVLNNTRVIPARLRGVKKDTGAQIEILLLRKLELNRWVCLVKPKKRIALGSVILFGDLEGKIVALESDKMEVEIEFDSSVDFLKFIDAQGQMPIPPYIRKGMGDQEDKRDYQTLFARESGSVAAPTASLHFTTDLIDKLGESGVDFSYITLHVGSASFLPVWDSESGTVTEPGLEFYSVTEEASQQIKIAKETGRRVIAVGTTVTRALETWALNDTKESLLAETKLFIKPGFNFQVIDGLITNFHQPGTTHMLLVEAFLGSTLIDRAYQHALTNNYRFLSYGDAMLVFR